MSELPERTEIIKPCQNTENYSFNIVITTWNSLPFRRVAQIRRIV